MDALDDGVIHGLQGHHGHHVAPWSAEGNGLDHRPRGRESLSEFGAVDSGGYRGVSAVDEGGTREANGQGAVFRTEPVVVVRIRREGVCR